MTYELLPFVFDVARAEVISGMIRKIAMTENLFASHLPPCASEPSCVEDKDVREMCSACFARLATISAALSANDSRVFEVWATPPSEEGLVGIVYFSDIVPEGDALGHYVFFDHRLADKTEVIEEAIGEMFTLVRRLTIEIPKPFLALARHASSKLGFGGGFEYTLKGGTKLRLEGVKKEAAVWQGEPTDVLVLGRLRDPKDA